MDNDDDDDLFDMGIGPPLEAPSLDAILNENSDEDDLSDFSPDVMQTSAAASAGPAADASGSAQPSSASGAAAAATASNTATAPPQPTETPEEKRLKKHGRVLRMSALNRVSQHLRSESTRGNAGFPTALAVRGVAAIGTSRGVVLVYDNTERPLLILSSTGVALGAVVSIDINRECTRMVCGYESGAIARWDLGAGKATEMLTDVNAPGTAVIRVAAGEDDKSAWSVNAKGAVYSHHFKKILGMRKTETSCLFSEGRGHVCNMQLLHSGKHPLPFGIGFIAFGTMSQIVVAYFNATETRVAFALNKDKDDGGLIPSMAWNYVPIKTETGRTVVDPVLAFSWGNTLRFVQVSLSSDAVPFFTPLSTYEAKVPILATLWLTDRTVLTVDEAEKLSVVDVRTMTLVECRESVRVRLVHNTQFAKWHTDGNNSGGNSPALRDYGMSLRADHGTLFLLQADDVVTLSLYTWKERLDYFASKFQFVEAITLALTFLKDQAMAVIGLPRNEEKRRMVVREAALDLIQAYADISVASANVSEKDFIKGVVSLCVDVSLFLQSRELLFGELYERFASQPASKAAFLEHLEPLILDDRLKSLPPAVMKEFFEHYEATERAHLLEECILHMDVSNMDIHQVVLLCWTHGLYDAMIYVYNRGMEDFTTPLRELFHLLRSAIRVHTKEPGRRGNMFSRLTDEEQRLGNRLLLYIHHCLSGRAFPRGDIPQRLVRRVKWEVYRHIIDRKGDREDNESFPYTRTLLMFDTKEFLNVLTLAFDEPDLPEGDGPPLPSRQVVVDILLEIMVIQPAKEGGISAFSPEQVGCLFTFLARQMARHEGLIMVERRMFEQVLDNLSDPYDTSMHEERQQALLELLNAGGIVQFDENRLLRLALSAKFLRVCELIYERRGEASLILPCYLNDPARRSQVFAFLHQALQSPRYTDVEKSKLQDATISSTRELVLVDPQATARFMLLHFNVALNDIVRSLQSAPLEQLAFLHGVFQAKQSGEEFEGMTIAPDIHELYLELLCQHRPTFVYVHLRNVAEYRIDECLEICQRYRISDATCWLLERKGRIREALALLLAGLKTKLAQLNTAFEQFEKQGKAGDTDERAVALAGIRDLLAVSIQMCLRVSPHMEEADVKDIWFSLLDEVVVPQREMKKKLKTTLAEYVQIIRDLTRYVVNSMMGLVPAPATLKKVMEDSSFTGTFGEMKDLILGMLETFNYEFTLMETTNRIVETDLTWSMHLRQRLARRAYVTIHNRDDMAFGPADMIAANAQVAPAEAPTGNVRELQFEQLRSVQASRRDELWLDTLDALADADHQRMQGREISAAGGSILTRPEFALRLAPQRCVVNKFDPSSRRDGVLPETPRFRSEFKAVAR
eukprot:m.202930 g.202930  ORF g.202930 m.202930 type:complete len:1369 (+) comp17729_c0_seq1:162-4268(+)